MLDARRFFSFLLTENSGKLCKLGQNFLSRIANRSQYPYAVASGIKDSRDD